MKDEEYLMLREEIMMRTGFHNDYFKTAITLTAPMWSAGIILFTFFIESQYIAIFTFVFLFPVLIILSLSYRVYENYVAIVYLSTYLRKFHETDLEANNGKYFSWETALENLRSHLGKKINRRVGGASNELTTLSMLSLLLFGSFSVFALWLQFHLLFAVFLLAAGCIGIGIWWFRIRKNSSYIAFKKLKKESEEWKNEWWFENK